MPQPGALPKMPESVFETALFDSGRPVLVVPQGFGGMVGKRILFAWNGSTESARAISLAMPVLSGAESIDVLSVDGAMVPGPSAAEIAESLRSHGLNVTSQHVKPGNRSAGQTIVDTAVSRRRRPDRQGRLHAKPPAPDDLRRHDAPSHPQFDPAGAVLVLTLGAPARLAAGAAGAVKTRPECCAHEEPPAWQLPVRPPMHDACAARWPWSPSPALWWQPSSSR